MEVPRRLLGVASASIASRRGVRGEKHIVKKTRLRVSCSGEPAREMPNIATIERRKHVSATDALPCLSESQPKTGVVRRPAMFPTENRTPTPTVDMPTIS